MTLRLDRLEDEYFEFIEKNCQCDIENEGCCCPDFERWYEAELEWSSFEG